MTLERTNATSQLSVEANAAPKRDGASSRLQSLDVLRGLTVAIMIMVNTSGDYKHTYPFLDHSAWNGCTLADVVFPCFIFMVGISSVFSISGRLSRGVQRGVIILQAAKRSLIIFALGLVVNSFPYFAPDTLRVFGVLQRIALCYFVITLLLLFSGARTMVIALLSILIGYWVLLSWVPVPGSGMPERDVPFLDAYANLPAWLDRHLLPARHLYRGGFYDPEGLLSSVSSLSNTLIGALAGMWIRSSRRLSESAYGLLAASFVCLAAGFVWNYSFPLNKRLWTGSFVLWTSGISLLALVFFFWLLDVRERGARWVYPAMVFGTNALTAYIFSELLASLLGAIHLPSGQTLQHWFFRPFAMAVPNPRVAALAYALAFVGVCFVPNWMLYRRRIFVKI